VTLSAEYDPKVVSAPSRIGVAISLKPWDELSHLL
jgi:voltage-dependent anion channel protein 2